MSPDAYCKGSFMLGTACGKCSRCLENLEKIKATTGLVSPEELRRTKLALDRVMAEVEVNTDRSFGLHLKSKVKRILETGK